jgi:hypothetical protein
VEDNVEVRSRPSNWDGGSRGSAAWDNAEARSEAGYNKEKSVAGDALDGEASAAGDARPVAE